MISFKEYLSEGISNNMRLISKIKKSGVVKSGSMAKDAPKPKKFEEETDPELTNLRRHQKWHPDRYDGLKKKGLHHHQIQKVWDDEVQAEIEAAKMNSDRSAGKAAKK